MLGEVLPTDQAERQLPGVHLIRGADRMGGEAELASERVWDGDARSVGLYAEAADTPRIFVGTEPADVLRSADGGKTWLGSDGFRDIPSRREWSFPAPPHEPHVLSLEFLRPPGPDTLAGPAAQESSSSTGDGPPVVVAGIEVGGVLRSPDGGASWEALNAGLYTDIHSCRIDPHDQTHWVAATGGGIYHSVDAGRAWQQLTQGMRGARRYPVGLAFNPTRRGELLVTAGDRPPAIGVHVMHSLDGGASFEDITDAVFSGECAQAKGALTPVPYFYQGHAILGSDTGHLLERVDDGRRWQVLARLPHPILCLAAGGQSTASIMH